MEQNKRYIVKVPIEGFIEIEVIAYSKKEAIKLAFKQNDYDAMFFNTHKQLFIGSKNKGKIRKIKVKEID